MTCASIKAGGNVVNMCIVPVKVKKVGSRKTVQSFALLDSCSQGTFISEDLAKELEVCGRKTSVTLRTINGEETSNSMAVNGIEVAGIQDEFREWLPLPTTYTRSELPVDKSDVTKPSQLKRWRYLDDITNQFNDYDDTIPVGLLIGANCVQALEPIDVIQSRQDGPYALKTRLGWYVVGPVNGNDSNRISCNKIAVQQAGSSQIGNHFFQIKSHFQENDVADMLKQIYNHDFTEAHHIFGKEVDEMSQDDIKFLQIVEEGTKFVDGHYEVPLPFRRSDITLPNNRGHAGKRFIQLQKKMTRNAEFKDHYFQFMGNLLSKGYAKKVPSTDRMQENSWYLPHHGVYHPSKPSKIRVVFDLSAEHQGKSLNKELLSGPDLANQLNGVLLRFREEQIAVTGDIESMYHQVRIPENQQNYLRFLWWQDNDMHKEVIDHKMTAHVFGGISSPSCCNFALKKTASDNEVKYGEMIGSILKRNFYVDDMLKSFPSEEAAINSIKQVKALCKEGGFNLTKFSSSSIHVLKSVPDNDRKEGLRTKDLIKGNIPDNKALGVKWIMEDDKLGFDIKMNETPSTRRGLLSALSSIYDPLGLGAPFLLKGRMIIQQLCKKSLSWDDPIDDITRYDWLKWQNNLRTLSCITIPRCLKPKGFGKIINCTIHHFSDACESGYGQCSYIRLVNDRQQVHCSLLVGKSRVAPLKFISIPRLELTAATVSVKVSIMLKDELDIHIDDQIYWTDSQVVLGYIKSDVRRFKIFVANRVQQIRDSTNVNQWHYIESSRNPADDASRGLDSKDKEKIKRWFEGPAFLWKKQPCWSNNCNTMLLPSDDPELKKVINVHTLIRKDEMITTLERMTSSWMKMKRIVAIVLIIRNIWLKRIGKLASLKEINGMINVELLEDAQNKIFMMVQGHFFNKEIKTLQSNGQTIQKESYLYKLTPFISHQGLLRVGGRLRRSDLSGEECYPAVLPRNCSISKMIALWSHNCVAHGGRGMTLNHLRRSGIWIINANSLVRSVIHRCVICRKLRGKVGTQIMADLPQARCQEAPPFTYTGVDMFGPIMIKQRRSLLKRYGALFTCFSSRAVHIEIANAIDSDSFILALRRFMARRGEVRCIWSDNGTNFVGADNELKKAFKEMDHEKIKGFMQNRGADWIQWKYNPPSASHMGGVWERQIRSARNILNGLMKTHGQSMNDESLQTLMAEVESIINSRPLTTETLSDVNSSIPLSPSNLLTMKTNVVMPPPGEFMKPNLYSKKRWRRVQHIAEEFWNRWRKEFLQTLQYRQKWNIKKRNFQIGDIVLLKDDCLRNQWPMAIITDVEVDSNGDVRSATLKVSNKESGKCHILRRPISKMVLLVESENDSPTKGAIKN